MKKIYKSLLFIGFFLLFSLTGCELTFFENNRSSTTPSNNQKIILYNYVSENLFIYNLEEKKIVNNLNQNGTLQYAFNDPTIEIFSSSTVFKKDFIILKEENNSIKTLLQLPQNTAVYPLAKKDEENYFFQMHFFDVSGNEIKNKRQIILFNTYNNHILPIQETTGIEIISGAFVAPYLYFTDYNKVSNTYRLNRINLNLENSMLEIFDQNLKTGDIYSDGKNIWLSDKSFIYLENKTFSKKNFNYFYNDYLIQLTKDNNKTSLEVTKIDNGVTLYNLDNVLSFEVDEKKLIVYGNNFIEQKYLF